MIYTPNPVPGKPEEIPRYLNQEVEVIARVFANASDALYLMTLHTAPAKVKDGMVVIADGTDWDPGAGNGMYRYKSGTGWVFIG